LVEAQACALLLTCSQHSASLAHHQPVGVCDERSGCRAPRKPFLMASVRSRPQEAVSTEAAVRSVKSALVACCPAQERPWRRLRPPTTTSASRPPLHATAACSSPFTGTIVARVCSRLILFSYRHSASQRPASLALAALLSVVVLRICDTPYFTN
jgi:hypothetical protein